MNICRKCYYWHSCMQYRYKNIEKDYMEQVERKQNKDGDTVIYVEKCTKFLQCKPFKGPIFK